MSQTTDPVQPQPLPPEQPPVVLAPSPPARVRWYRRPAVRWSLRILAGLLCFALVVGLRSLLLMSLKRPSQDVQETAFTWQGIFQLPEPQNPQPLWEEQRQFWRTLAGAEPLLRRSTHLTFKDGKLTARVEMSVASTHPLARAIPAEPMVEEMRSHLLNVLFGFVTVDGVDLMSQGLEPLHWATDVEHQRFTLHRTTTHEPGASARILAYRSKEVLLPAIEDTLTVEADGAALSSVAPVPRSASSSRLVFDTQELADADSVQFLVQRAVPDVAAEPADFVPESSTFRDAMKELHRLTSSHALVSLLLHRLFPLLPLVFLMWLLRRWSTPERPTEKPRWLLGRILLLEVLLQVLSTLTELGYGSQWLFNLHVDFSGYRDRQLFWLVEEGCTHAGTLLLGVLLPAMLLQDLEATAPPGPHSLARRVLRWAGGLGWGVLMLGLLAACVLTALAFEDEGFIPWTQGMWLLGSASALLLAPVFGLVYRVLAGHRAPAGVPMLCTLLLATQVGLYRFGFDSAFWLGTATLMNAALLVGFVRAALSTFPEVLAGLRAFLKRLVPGSVDAGTPSLPGWSRGLLALAVLAVALPIPFVKLFTQPLAGHDLYGVRTFAFWLSDALGLAWVAGVAWMLRAHVKDSQVDARGRVLGILLAVQVLFLQGSWELASVRLGLGVLGLWLLVRPSPYGEAQGPVFARVVPERRALLDSLLTLSALDKSSQALRKTLHGKLAAGELSVEDYQSKVAAHTQAVDAFHASSQVEGLTIKAVALAFGPETSAWRNGLHGARFSLLFAAPWTLALTLNALNDPFLGGTYPLWGFSLVLANALLRWGFIGFFLGFFFPYLRGSSGLVKSLWLCLALVLPSVPAMLLDNTGPGAWRASGLWALQLFVQCVLLGLVAFDYRSLKQGRHHWQMLFEVHGLPSVGVSVSSVVLAIGTTVTTLLNDSTKDVVTLLFKFLMPGELGDLKPPQ